MTKQRVFVVSGALAATLALGACSTGRSERSNAAPAAAPNVDFYFLLDTSPSMELAATSSGMASLKAATQANEGGCAFGCHQSNSADLHGFKTSDGAQIGCTANGAYADGAPFDASSKFPSTGRDNYDLSRCLGVTLRIDLLREAVQTLVATADQMQKADSARYRIALFETAANQSNPADDLDLYTLQPMTGDLGPGGAGYAAARSIAPLEMYENNHLAAGDSDADMDTDLDSDIASVNGLIPPPGAGGKPGDAAQEVLFIVTDGLNDKQPPRTYSPMDWSGVNCSTVKNRGVRIAVLYTTYEPMTDPWYLFRVVPALPKGLPPGLQPSTPIGSDPMALAAQQCASPGLYLQVSTDGDIVAAMRTLFRRTIQPVRLRT